jgi:CrcB protein
VVTALLVALGGALGAATRYALAQRWDSLHPWGTYAANSAGCLALGALSGAGLNGHPAALLGVGFCGALTTFSSFAVQVHDGGPRAGGAYALMTLATALLLVTLGFVVGVAAT